MPNKNKPKRLHRNRRWRVGRRKAKKAKLLSGNSRNRKPRPKNKGKVTEVRPVVSKKPVEKSVVKKVVKKAVKKAVVKKVVKKE